MSPVLRAGCIGISRRDHAPDAIELKVCNRASPQKQNSAEAAPPFFDLGPRSFGFANTASTIAGHCREVTGGLGGDDGRRLWRLPLAL
jgi:hypothetical protein